MTTVETATYSMEDSFPSSGSNHHQPRAGRHHRRGGSEGSGASLTYSAGSSVQSAGSAAGESTDSSFADIMRVLDLQDSKELQEFIQREGVDPRIYVKNKAQQQQQQQQVMNANVCTNSMIGSTRDEKSVTSLAYSTDGDSALNDEKVLGLQTISGQPSDSYGPDGGGIGLRSSKGGNGSVLKNEVVFAPADAVARKRSAIQVKRKSSSLSSSAGSSTGSVTDRKSIMERSASLLNSGSGTPPPAPRTPGRGTHQFNEDEGVWYAKWWMCGFTDAFQDLVPQKSNSSNAP